MPFFRKKASPQKKQEDKSLLSSLKTGLSKSSSRLNEGLKDIFVRQKLDESALEELEDILIMSDMGAQVAAKLVDEVRQRKFNADISLEEVKQVFADSLAQLLKPAQKSLHIDEKATPFVMMFCGVNGTGKTTTIGKLASALTADGKKVMIVACDTYRAAAVEQLEVWARRAKCGFEKGTVNADPASVAYQGLLRAKDQGYDVVMVDTAGRLQNKSNLMEQLTKIVRVLGKQDQAYPHENIIVLDATTGQNALEQVKLFGEAVPLTGLILTKLDGTAKGGIIANIVSKHTLPVYSIGVGEQAEDLQCFDAQHFAKELIGIGK